MSGETSDNDTLRQEVALFWSEGKDAVDRFRQIGGVGLLSPSPSEQSSSEVTEVPEARTDFSWD